MIVPSGVDNSAVLRDCASTFDATSERTANGNGAWPLVKKYAVNSGVMNEE